MKSNKLLASLFLAFVGVVLTLYISLFFSPPSMFVKDSQTSLAIESPILLIRDGSRGVEVSVIGHSYDPPGIREFVSRVYHFVPGNRIEIKTGDLASIRTKNLYFINRSTKDGISPVAAEFTVNWVVESKGKGRVAEIERGTFNAKLLDSTLKDVPMNLKKFDETNSEIPGIALNLTELDSIFTDSGKGSYFLEMKGSINYTFFPWSDYNISNNETYTIFTAEVSYSNHTHEDVNFYYPMNFFTENVRITHPYIVRAKQTFGMIK
jgi:hypothetical protein